MKIEIKKNQIWVGKKSIPLISGEVHYWRLNPSYWKDILASVRDAGLKVIATYVPWDYHEYKRGSLDFTGKTHETRNLKRFLELTRREGFWVIIRPGPYIYSEWPNEGAPAYAHQYHRLHPVFLKLAKNYITEVSKVIKPYLASRKNGHIILLQADNEIDPWPDVFGPQYGFGHKPGLFQEFIKDLYHGNLRDLNESWGTQYKTFEEARPYIATMLQGENGLQLKGDKELQHNLDYFRFKYFYSKKTAEWNVQTYREQGIDVPVYLNVYPFFYAHDWHDLQSVSDLIGIDLYPTSELSEDAFEQRKIIDKIRFLSNVSKVPYIAEFASGVWHQRHYDTGVLPPNHYRLLSLSAILGGIAGWNWYMLVNRDNWYMSPINEWGRVRHELYDVFKQMVSVYNKMYPPTLQKLTNVAATYVPLQYAARTMGGHSPIMVALYDADIDYNLYDPRRMDCREKVLFYSGNQWLDEASHRNLRSYVEAGGTLIAFRDYPRKNERFKNVSIIGFEDPVSTLFEFKKGFELRMSSKRPGIKLVSSVYTFPETSGENIKADFGTYGQHVIGYIKKVGKGRIIHLGVDPTPALALELLDYLKVGLTCFSTTKDIKTALFQRGDTYYMVVTNNGAEAKSATIHIPELDKFKGNVRFKNLLDESSENYSRERRKPFSAELARKDGTVFELKPLKK